MSTLIILSLTIINSFLIINHLFTRWRLLTKIGTSIPIAIIFLGSFLFAIYAIYKPLLENLFFILSILLATSFGLLFYLKNELHFKNFKLSIVEIFISLGLAFFSGWLMFGSFSYDVNKPALKIGPHLWSDFGAHIPLIRSFSLGENFPPQFPLFPNENIRYHFLFYFLIGIFEKFGENIAFSMNMISTLAFFSLGILVFELSRTIFDNKKSIGILAVLLTFLNSSLTFIYVFKDHNLLNIDTYKFLWERANPFANAPYGNGEILTFWNLNIYLNQRHLALAFAAALIIILFFYQVAFQKGKPKLSQFILIGLLTGLLPLWHAQVFLMVAITSFLISIIFFRKNLILPIIIYEVLMLILAVPQILWLQSNSQQSSVLFHPGYLIPPPLTLPKTLFWWLQNLGFTMLIAIESILRQRRELILFYLCFLPIFLLGFLFQFGPDIATNHKFFNFWLIITNIFIAVLLVKIASHNIFGKITAVCLFILLTLSGILELFPIKNDGKIELKDWQLNPVSNWVVLNTPKDATFLTSNSLYHPVSLAGRKVFLGWPYFAWSSGSDTFNRGNLVKSIYLSNDKQLACKLLLQNKIFYVSIEEDLKESLYWQNKQFFDNNFVLVYKGKAGDVTYNIYDAASSCIG